MNPATPTCASAVATARPAKKKDAVRRARLIHYPVCLRRTPTVCDLPRPVPKSLFGVRVLRPRAANRLVRNRLCACATIAAHCFQTIAFGLAGHDMRCEACTSEASSSGLSLLEEQARNARAGHSPDIACHTIASAAVPRRASSIPASGSSPPVIDRHRAHGECGSASAHKWNIQGPGTCTTLSPTPHGAPRMQVLPATNQGVRASAYIRFCVRDRE